MLHIGSCLDGFLWSGNKTVPYCVNHPSPAATRPRLRLDSQYAAVDPLPAAPSAATTLPAQTSAQGRVLGPHHSTMPAVGPPWSTAGTLGPV